MTKTLLSKPTYNKVVRGLDHIRKQDERDIRENPHAIRIDWKQSIKSMIEHTVRENRERYSDELGEQVVEYLIEKKLLVPYCGGVSFPGTVLPSEQEIRSQTLKTIQQLKELAYV